MACSRKRSALGAGFGQSPQTPAFVVDGSNQLCTANRRLYLPAHGYGVRFVPEPLA